MQFAHLPLRAGFEEVPPTSVAAIPVRKWERPFNSRVIALNWVASMKWNMTPRFASTTINLHQSNWLIRPRSAENSGYGIRQISLSYVTVRQDGKNGKPKKSFSA